VRLPTGPVFELRGRRRELKAERSTAGVRRRSEAGVRRRVSGRCSLGLPECRAGASGLGFAAFGGSLGDWREQQMSRGFGSLGLGQTGKRTP